MFAVIAAASLAIAPEAREALFSRLKQSVVVLETGTGSRTGNGTGFVLREDGLVVTNHHVVHQQASLTAVLSNGQRLTVTGVVLLDEAHDLAVVQVDAKGLTPLELGSSTNLREGSQIFMAGNPLGLDFTFTEGVVTALRPQGIPEHVPGTKVPADRQALLQLSVGGAPGSSGSPIVDADGKVVGIERAGISGGGAEFAVPVETLRLLLTDEVLTRQAEPLRPFPWVNLAISAAAIAGVILFLMGRRLGGARGKPRAQRRFTGYEE